MAMGNLLDIALDDLHNLVISHSKPQSTGKGKVDIFPLPLSSPVIEGSRCPSMARATCRALNSLYGVPLEREKVPVSAGCERAIRFICSCVDAMALWTEVFPPWILRYFSDQKGWTIVERKLEWPRNFPGKLFHLLCLPKSEAFHLLISVHWGPNIMLSISQSFWCLLKKGFWGGHRLLWSIRRTGWMSIQALFKVEFAGSYLSSKCVIFRDAPCWGGCSE